MSLAIFLNPSCFGGGITGGTVIGVVAFRHEHFAATHTRLGGKALAPKLFRAPFIGSGGGFPADNLPALRAVQSHI
jgi:hypothetical protein